MVIKQQMKFIQIILTKLKISYGKYDPNADLCMICSIIPILEQNPVTPSTKFNQGAYPDLVNEYTQFIL